jgi:Mg2+ and Co2+ transporter CorA
MVVEAFVQMKHSADNLISLIFNTITSAQNETMKMLTRATIFFLPMTFVASYFGMNFKPFDVLQEDVAYLSVFSQLPCLPSLRHHVPSHPFASTDLG